MSYNQKRHQFRILQNFAEYFLLVLVVWATHSFIVPYGIALHNSEWSAFLLAADKIREGYFSAFAFQCDYGGLTLTYVRAFFVAFWTLFSEDTLQAHMFFSYVVVPALLVLSCYFMVLQYVEKKAAFLTALFASFGFQIWVFLTGNDFYPMYLMLGFVLFGIRAKMTNIFVEKSKSKIFIVGLIIGQMIYASRATLPIVVAFFLNWGWLRVQILDFLTLRFSKKPALKGLFWIAVILISSGVYLEAFGRDLGSIFGRQIRMDGKPNLHIAAYLIAIYWLAANYKTEVLPRMNPIGIIFGGVFFGLLPEIVHWMRLGLLGPPHVIFTQSFQESFSTLGYLPSRLRMLVSGDQAYRVLSLPEDGIGQNACALLLIVSLFFVGKSLRKKKSIESIAWIVFLIVGAFCRIKMPYEEVAPARYLVPLFIAYLVGLALFFEWSFLMFKKSKNFQNKVISCVVYALVVGSVFHQLHSRLRMVDQIKASDHIDEVAKITTTFLFNKINFVISDDFWFSNNLIVFSNWKLKVWASWRNWGPEEIQAEAHSVRRAGILLSADKGIQEFVDLLGKKWRLKFIKKIGSKVLYSGQAV
ncbi:MAG: hypothetical protein AB7F43_03970 [Bacteriovoracia bacterium]